MMSNLLLFYIALLSNCCSNLIPTDPFLGNLILDTSSSKSNMPMMSPMMASHYNPFAVYPQMQGHSTQHEQPPHFTIHPIYIEDHSALHHMGQDGMHHEEPQHHMSHEQHHASIEYEHHPQHHEEEDHHSGYPEHHHEEEHHGMEHHHDEHQPEHHEEEHHMPEMIHHHGGDGGDQSHYQNHHQQLMSMLMHGAGSTPQLYQQFMPPINTMPTNMMQQAQFMLPLNAPNQQLENQNGIANASSDNWTKSSQTETHSQQLQPTAKVNDTQQDNNSLASSLLNLIIPRGLKKEIKQKQVKISPQPK